MKNKITLFILTILTTFCYAQNNIDAKLLDFAKYQASKGLSQTGYYWYDSPQVFPPINIADDFGPRKLGADPFNWHSGVDYNNNQDGNGDEGDFILSPSKGTLEKYGLDLNDFKWLCIDNEYYPQSNSNTTEHRYFYYEHIFKNNTSIPYNFYGMEVRYVDNDNGSKNWAIIFKDCQSNNCTQGSYRAIGHPVKDAAGNLVAKKVSFKDEKGNLQTIDVDTQIQIGWPIAGLGGSGWTDKAKTKPYDPHNHAQMLTTLISSSAGGSPGSSANDFFSKNALEYINHEKPIYDISFNDETNTANNVVVKYPGNEATKIRVIAAIQGMPINPSVSDANFKRYNKIYNIDRVKINISPDFSNSYSTIQGGKSWANICLGSQKNSSTSNTLQNSTGLGSWKNNGINPFAYSGIAPTGTNGQTYNSQPYDEFYYVDFLTRVHNLQFNSNKNTWIADNPANARYSDGKYKIAAEVETVAEKRGLNDNIEQKQYSQPIILNIDNYFPFIQRVKVKFEKLNYFTYNVYWDGVGRKTTNAVTPNEKDLVNPVDGIVTLVESNKCRPKEDLDESVLGKILISVHTNEPIQNPVLNIVGIGNLNPKLVGKNVIVSSNTYETQFEITGYGNSLKNFSEFIMNFKAIDFNNNPLLDVSQYALNKKDFKVPKRKKDGSTINAQGQADCVSLCWEPIPLFGSDYFHKFSLDPASCGKFIIGDNTANKSAVECIKSIDDVTVNTKNSSGNDGSITLTFPANTGGYAIRWLQNGIVLLQYNDLTTITNLTSGLYCFEIVCECCRFSDCVEVPPCPSLLVSSTIYPTCANTSNGSIKVTAGNGTAPYTYAWSAGTPSNGATVNGLGIGTHSVTITDKDGCKSTHSFLMKERIEITPKVNHICETGTNGSIELNVVANFDDTQPGGFVVAYTWEKLIGSAWTIITGEESPNIYKLSKGKYKVTIFDGLCSTLVREFEVKESNLDLSFSVLPEKIANSSKDGSITFVVKGTAPIEFTITGPSFSEKGTSATAPLTKTFNNLHPGIYSLKVKDANCEKEILINVYSCDNASGFSSIQGQVTQISAAGVNDGKITLTFPAQFNKNVTYSWTGPNGFVATSKDIANLSAGIYYINIYDKDCIRQINLNYAVINKNCTFDFKVNFKEDKCGILDVFIEPENSAGNEFLYSSGSAFNLFHSSYWPSYSLQGSGSFGLETITMINSNGCIAVKTMQPPTLLNNISDVEIDLKIDDCFIESANINANALYKGQPCTDCSIEWWQYKGYYKLVGLGNQVTLKTGDYEIRVKKGNSKCYFLKQLSLKGSIKGIVTVDACNGQNNGEIRLNIDAKNPVKIIWDDGTNDLHKTNLAAGKYKVNVTDEKGCNVSEEIEVGNFSVNTKVVQECSTDGNATLESNGVFPLNLEFDNIDGRTNYYGGSLTIKNGINKIFITDARGCKSEVNVDASKFFYAFMSNKIKCAGELTEINAFVNNPLSLQTNSLYHGPYFYEWSNYPNSSVNGIGVSSIDAVIPAKYSIYVQVTSAAGCMYMQV